MDKQIIEYYRNLLREGFAHVGKMEEYDVFIDSIGEKIQVCGSISRAYMHIYISIKADIIEKISYLCICDPTANVVMEIMCSLAEGKDFRDIKHIKPEDFTSVLDNTGQEFLDRARNTIALLVRGLQKYEAQLPR